MNKFLFRLAISIAFFGSWVASVQAQSLAGPSCRFSVRRQIPFSSPTAQDRLTVSIGAGPCHSARLSFVVTSAQGGVLYRYVAPFKRHVSTPWDDPELPRIARQFVDDTALGALVPKTELPSAKPESDAEDADGMLAVPAPVFQRLIGSGQPMLYHPTSYKGGQYVVFDPVTRSARVVLRRGV